MDDAPVTPPAESEPVPPVEPTPTEPKTPAAEAPVEAAPTEHDSSVNPPGPY